MRCRDSNNNGEEEKHQEVWGMAKQNIEASLQANCDRWTDKRKK